MDNNPYMDLPQDVIDFWKDALENPPENTSKEVLEWARKDLELVNEALQSREQSK